MIESYKNSNNNDITSPEKHNEDEQLAKSLRPTQFSDFVDLKYNYKENHNSHKIAPRLYETPISQD